MKVTKVDVRPNSERRTSRTRIYVFPKENVLENLMNRFSRPSKAYKALLPNIFAEAFPDLDAESRAKMIKKTFWNQRAGCGCGCSPGFVINGGWSYGKEVYVDVAGDDAKVDPAKAGLAHARGQQIGLVA